uniref:Homing endonuclease LAGLIDADG domain-containing protein n=2 Tax=Tremella fuciformis TaxID=64657 RepID=A0A2H4QC37_9TREE|nr:hypothetical protein [Tremella fuciformis]ATX62025.1 hypothetical protein [Tremella fuciformis]
MKNINTNIFHPAWVVGFIDGEGTFFIGLNPNKTMALGVQVQLQFSVTQHIRDVMLMNNLVNFFNAGYIAPDGTSKVQFRMRDFGQLENNLFPLLDQYPLMTQKRLDAEAFRKVHSMMKQGLHLTSTGLDEIRAIKSTMNRARMTGYKKS